MAVTIKEIAERSGVSIKTVSRVLSNQGHLHRPETAKKVMSIARELGYLSNSSARSLRQGRFNAVALVLSYHGIRSLMPDGLLHGIQRALATENLNLILTRPMDEDLTDPNFVPRILREWMVDGLLINYNADFPPAMTELITTHALPSVWINSKHAADCIYPDDLECGRLATQHLIDLGHRFIAFVNWKLSSHYSEADRRSGYRERMQAAGLTPRFITEEPDLRDADRARRSMPWLFAPNRPTAIVTYTPHVAMPMLYAAALLGLKVPEDLSLITVSDRLESEIGRPIDAALLPEEEIGTRSVQQLLNKIEHPTVRLMPCAVPPTLVTGHTTAPCRREVNANALIRST